MRFHVRACLAAASMMACSSACGQTPAAEPLAAPTPAAAAAASAQDMGYAMGFRIGQQILAEHTEMGTPVDHESLATGLSDAVSGGKSRLDEGQLRAALASLEAAMRRKQQEMAVRMQSKRAHAKPRARANPSKPPQGQPGGVQPEWEWWHRDKGWNARAARPTQRGGTKMA